MGEAPNRTFQWQTHFEHRVQRLQAVILTAPNRGQEDPDMDVAMQRRAECTNKALCRIALGVPGGEGLILI